MFVKSKPIVGEAGQPIEHYW